MVDTRHSCPEPLGDWLEAHGQGGLARAGLHPLVTYSLGAAQEGMPVVPPEVLTSWALTLRNEHVMLMQSTLAFLDRAQRAGMSDPVIVSTIALPLSPGQTLDEYRAFLLDKVEEWRRRAGMADR